MESMVQEIFLPANMSFIAKTYDSSFFETGWHHHTEYELVFFLKGTGTANIGQQKLNFKPNNIFLLGSNLPHTFQKTSVQPINAIVVLFNSDCFGIPFMNMPECRQIKELLDQASGGLFITCACKNQLKNLIKSIETAANMNRLLLLLQCLQSIATSEDYTIVSPQPRTDVYQKNRDKIDKVYQFTLESFQEPLCLSQVAAIACMSVASFSNHFKRRTQKTYIDFLNEVRIGHACHQLIQTDKPVIDIGYESGFNTVAYFYRLFLRTKQMTPLQYRKTYTHSQNRKDPLLNTGIKKSMHHE